MNLGWGTGPVGGQGGGLNISIFFPWVFGFDGFQMMVISGGRYYLLYG